LFAAILPAVTAAFYARQKMKAYHPKNPPSKWPFPARPGNKKPANLTRGNMVADVCLVAVWGATIPGLMWLGAAGGF